MKIGIKLEEGVELPKYAKVGDSGIDLKAWKYSLPSDLLKMNEFEEGGFVLEPFERVLVRTGISFDIPVGTEIQVRPRSGLSLKNGIVAQFGTIDSNYIGDVGIILANISKDKFIIKKGDRLAQIVVANVIKAELEEVNVVTEKNRGADGFGSTGK